MYLSCVAVEQADWSPSLCLCTVLMGRSSFVLISTLGTIEAELKKQHSKVSMTASSPDALEFQEINQDVGTIFLPLKGHSRGVGCS